MPIIGRLKHSPKFTQAAYGLMMGGVALLGFVKLLMLADVLGVSSFGLYVFFIALEAYLIPLMTLGLMESVFREYPILLGRGDVEKAYKLRNKSLMIILRIMTFALMAALIFSLFFAAYEEVDFVLWAAIGMLHIIANTLFLWGLREVRSRLKSLEYALAMMLKFILDVAILAVALWDLNVFSYLLLEAVVLMVISVFVFCRIPEVREVKEVGLLKGMVKSGFSLFGASSLGTLSITGDRLILGAGLPASNFSIYAFNGIVFQAGLSLASIVYQYIQPVVMHSYGREGSLRGVYCRLESLFLWFFVLGCLASPLIWWASSVLADQYYEDFQLGPVLFFCMYFAAVVHIGNFFSLILIAAKQIKKLYFCQLVSSVFLVLGLGVGFFGGMSLEYFGMVFLASRLLSLLLLLTNSRRLLNAN
jgi:O-antigen/teichoic acid export membrane protein